MCFVIPSSLAFDSIGYQQFILPYAPLVARLKMNSVMDKATYDKRQMEKAAKMEAEKKPWAKYYRGCVKSYHDLRDRKPQLVAEIDDLYERMNAVRPAVSRVTVKRK